MFKYFLAAAMAGTLLLSACDGTRDRSSPPEVSISVLSSPPGQVSAGTALLAVDASADLHQELELWVEETQFEDGDRASEGDRFTTLVSGLADGENRIEARIGDRVLASITLNNHPAWGPVISGPHQTPFFCHPESSGLGAAHDEFCHTDSVVEYYYRPTDPTTGTVGAGFLPLTDPTDPPADIARTTTTEGVETDFIVRVERGTLNRGVYQIAVLYDPAATDWTATMPQAQWNGRLYYAMEGSCRPGYVQGSESAGDILRDRYGQDEALGLGFAIARHSLTRQGNMCGNDQINAESMMMTKEHFIKHYGVPDWTIGAGGSGGAIQQHAIADNYPGLFDGLIPSASFPDVWSIAPGAADAGLLSNYFNEISPALWSDPQQRAAVSGFGDWTLGVIWTVGNVRNIDPRTYCDDRVPADQIFHPENNPQGVRCSIIDAAVNIFGRDPDTGFARRPLDNIGVQYGLSALNEGLITVEQFIDLNRHIGGFDVNGQLITERMEADPEALRIAYASGRVVNGGLGLAEVPIIDSGRYGDFSADYHDRFRAFSIRERLLRENGHADNHVILTTHYTDIPDDAAPIVLLLQMDQWLAGIAADERDLSRAEKIADARPDELFDACWDQAGEKYEGPVWPSDDNICNELYRPYGDPRIAAGAPLANDVMKCTLKAVDADDYAVAMSSEQLAELEAIFPDGVCDFSQAGVSQQAPLGTWLSWDDTH